MIVPAIIVPLAAHIEDALIIKYKDINVSIFICIVTLMVSASGLTTSRRNYLVSSLFALVNLLAYAPRWEGPSLAPGLELKILLVSAILTLESTEVKSGQLGSPVIGWRKDELGAKYPRHLSLNWPMSAFVSLQFISKRCARAPRWRSLIGAAGNSSRSGTSLLFPTEGSLSSSSVHCGGATISISCSDWCIWNICSPGSSGNKSS